MQLLLQELRNHVELPKERFRYETTLVNIYRIHYNNYASKTGKRFVSCRMTTYENFQNQWR